ncbi:putative transcription factor C2H2 family [Medicago truncatula]|uniref:Putative transcription factor C2H2 family n=1 Tax=Medicago truncatula TaxID=3880 RepID=G7KVP4_MEDTR|nr:zinc finger protein 8 [Medicago truncatula]AES78011.1 zinc finger-like protein, putative [Medicago truncatula]RHN44734.1 putative transcription factor C2H2 family [Medicago truncatula]
MASKSLSITATSQDEGDSFHTKEGVSMKANEDQPSKSNSSESVDSVKLSKHDVVSPIQVGSTSSFHNNSNERKDEKKNEEKISDVKYFSCSYCKGQYSTLQGLRGHQNAHKAERAMEKQRKEMYNVGALGLGQSHLKPYIIDSSASFIPYNNYRGLGVRMESTIQKPPYTNPRITPNGSKYGYGALRLNDVLHPSLFNLRNNIEASNTGVGTLGFGGASTSRIKDGTNNKIGAILKLGDSSTATSSSSNTNKKNVVATTSAMDDDIKSNIEEEPSNFDSSELDLTLKL